MHHNSARDADGRDVGFHSSRACAFTLIGAMRHVTGLDLELDVDSADHIRADAHRKFKRLAWREEDFANCTRQVVAAIIKRVEETNSCDLAGLELLDLELEWI